MPSSSSHCTGLSRSFCFPGRKQSGYLKATASSSISLSLPEQFSPETYLVGQSKAAVHAGGGSEARVAQSRIPKHLEDDEVIPAKSGLEWEIKTQPYCGGWGVGGWHGETEF